MPAALKTPLLEPDFAPDNSTSTSTSTSTLSPPAAPAKPASQASSRAAAAAVSGASSRAASPARISPRETPHEHEVAARPERSRPAARPEPSVEEARALSRPERRHRRFRPTITAVLCGCALMGQLVLLLWLHGKTLTAAREVEKMDAQIADVSNHIERTQERIAAFDSSPQIKHWAAEKGWKPATHLDFDDITKAGQARAAAQAQAEAQAAQSRGESGEVDAR